MTPVQASSAPCTTLFPAMVPARIDYQTVRSVSLDACRTAGIPGGHAQLQVDLLLDAELQGRPSHGLLRLPRLFERIANGVADPQAVGVHSWRGSLLDVDGQNGLGPVVADNALFELARRAREVGIAAAVISNNNHLGMLAWYAERIATQGLTLIALTTSEALVHPWGGKRAMIGTNPIAIGVPTPDGPFVMDMATSLVSMGQIHDYANRGQAIPSTWARDEDGEPTTDAVAAKRGSIAPFGEAKGYALGLAFELLVTSLTGAAIGRDVHGTLDADQICNKGDVFIVVHPRVDGDAAVGISAYLREVRRSGGSNTSLHVPGDRARRTRRENLALGVPLDPNLWTQLKQLAGTEVST